MAFQDYSLIQAPMAGGLSTADVVAGASRAGALGSVGAGYLSGDAIMAAAEGVRAAGGDACVTGAPVAVVAPDGGGALLTSGGAPAGAL